MKTIITMLYKYLTIFAFLSFTFNAFSFEIYSLNEIDPSENEVIENIYKPLKVTGDALPWNLFSKTKEIEDCTVDKDGYDYRLIKPLYDSEIKKFNDTTFIFTMPNSDLKSDFIKNEILKFCKKNKDCHVFKSMGSKNYFSCIKICDLVLGNSSSGILEAPSLNTGTINIGDRQNGRVQAKSVIK